MKKNNSNLLLIVNCILLAVVFTLIVMHFFNNSKPQIVYVDNVKLFNGFNMSKDLNKINADKINVQKKKMDSLFNVYSIFREQKNEEKTKELGRELRLQDQELRKMNEHFSNEVNQKVWNRLNQYIKEYGEKNHYKMVLGTQGKGNIMYAEDEKDITKDVLIYANSKYEGN